MVIPSYSSSILVSDHWQGNGVATTLSSPTVVVPTMDYDIFREELALKYPSYGYALWDPSPQGRYSAVQVGDVGFIHQGYFHRLFNILLPQDHPSHRDGAPPHHEPLEVNINMPTYRGTLPPNNLRSNGVSDTSDVDRRLTSEQSSFPSVGFSNYDPNCPDPGPDPATTRHSFSCSKNRGALLSLPLPAQREETAVRKAFEKFMVKHIDEWFAFAQGLGLGIDREWDLILVTGRHLARSWANVAFLERDQKVSFGFRVSRDSDVEWGFTSEGAGGAALNLGPIGPDLPEDQCIFVRGIRGMTFLQRLPRWLLGRASPPRMPGGFEPDPDVKLRSIPEDTHYQDPLYTLLEYISTQAPDCDMALVHDDDLGYIASASLESLRPDTLMSYLQKSAPEIRQVGFDLTPGSPTSHSKELPSKHKAMPQIIKVAMLATSDVAYDVESIIGQNERNVIDRSIKLSPRSHENLPPNAGAGITTWPQDTLEGLSLFVEEKRQRSINPVGFAPSFSQADGSVSQGPPSTSPNTLVSPLMKVSLSTQEGQFLKNAPGIATVDESLISKGGRNVIEEITDKTGEMGHGLDSNSDSSTLLLSGYYAQPALEPIQRKILSRAEIFHFYVNDRRAWINDFQVAGSGEVIIQTRDIAIVNRHGQVFVYTGTGIISEMLDPWPVSPVVITQHDRTSPSRPSRLSLDSSWRNIAAALNSEQHHRELDWYNDSWSHWKRFAGLMQKSLQTPTHPRVSVPDDIVPVLLDSLLGGSSPRLRVFSLGHGTFPAMRKLLMSTNDLVTVHLWGIPDSGYVSPEVVATCLFALPRLETLSLQFRSSRSPESASQRRPPLTHTLVPTLTQLEFKGVHEYLEDLVARFDAPHLHTLRIIFFMDIDFNVPELHHLVSRTEAFKAFDRATISIFNHAIRFLSNRKPVYLNRELMLQINCRELDRQLSSLRQVCSSSLPLISTLKGLDVVDEAEQSHWKDDGESAQWLELLDPFTAVKDLQLSDGVVPHVRRALQESAREGVTEVPPHLRSML